MDVKYLTAENPQEIVIDFTKSGDAPAILTALGATFSRSQTRYRWNADGSLTNLASDTMPITWTPGIGWAYKPEFAVISRWTQSNTPSNSSWTKTGYTVPGTTIASPMSGLSAYFISETATTAVHEVSRTQSASSGAVYCIHGVVKAEGRRYVAILFKTTNSVFAGETVVFDLTNKTIFSNPSNIPCGIYDRNGFVEIYATAIAAATATGTMSIVGCSDTGVPSTTTTYAGDTAKGFWWFNIQQTSARSLPPVIVTTSGTVTLTADSLSIPAANISRFDSNNTSIVADYAILPYPANSTGSLFAMAFNAGNLGQVYFNFASGEMNTQNSASGITVLATLPARKGLDTLAAGFSRGLSRLSVDGKYINSSSATRPTQAVTLYIGSTRTFGNQFSNPILKLEIYKNSLSPQRLAQLGRYIP